MSTCRSIAGVLLLLGPCLGSLAQEQGPPTPRQDSEFWLSISLRGKPFKKPQGRVYEKRFYRNFRAQGELGYRSDENFTSSKLFYGVLGARYRIRKGISAGLDYRYNVRGADRPNTSRIDGQVTLSTERGRFEAGYRCNFQHEFEAPSEFRDILRNKVGLDYNIRKFPVDPFTSAELFTLFHYTGTRNIGVRYELGASWKISKRQRLDGSVRHDREMNIADPRYRWIFALSYLYDLR